MAMLDYQGANHLQFIEPSVNTALNLTHAETNFNFAVGLYPNQWNWQEVDPLGYLELSIMLHTWSPIESASADA